MALFDNTWYVNAGDGSTTGWWAIPAWTSAAKAAGAIVRQAAAPTVLNERVFVCIVAGTPGGTEPVWVLTRGAKTTDGTVTWQEVNGQAALNGDHINAVTTAQTRSQVITLGQVIYDSGTASVQICTTAGTAGSGTPTFSTTKGTTTADSSVTWTSLGLASGYAAWANPAARLTSIMGTTWGAVAGSTIFVANTSQDSNSGGATWPNVGLFANPIKVLCVNAAGSMPPVAADLTTGALVCQTTVAHVNQLTASYIYGIEFRLAAINSAASMAGSLVSSGGTSSACWQIYKNCKFTCGSTNINTRWQLGNTLVALGGGTLEFEDCQIGMVTTAALFTAFGPIKFHWRNPSGIAGVTGVTGPPPQFQLFGNVGAASVDAMIDGVDLSALAPQPFATGSIINTVGNITFKDCAFRSPLASPAVAVASGGPRIDYMRSDSAGTNYQHQRSRYQGTLVTETAIVRTGGGQIEGTPLSWKIVTTANSLWFNPFLLARIGIANTLTGVSRTVTVYGTTHVASVPNNDEIWIEVAYPGSASTPLASFKTSTKSNILSANAPVASDGSVWGGGGSGAGWSPFALNVVLTSPNPAQVGTIWVQVKAAKPSSTWYIDPQPTIA
jgi:hypothetical protein